MICVIQRRLAVRAAAVVLLAAARGLAADVVTDWNAKAADILVASPRIGPPQENRVLAIVQTAVWEAVSAIGKGERTGGPGLAAPAGASVDAAVVAANRVVLSRLAPSRRAAVDAACDVALGSIPDGRSKADGIAVGEKAAEAVLAARAEDGSSAEESYRPFTTAGVFVPTTLPAAPTWPLRKTWLLASASQLRPPPPPGLASAAWAAAYEEIREVGGARSARRTPAQTEVARFWEATVPQIYQGVVHSVARQPGRDAARNARLLAAVTQAIDDALVAVFDAKYHYALWRPITAIRNGDADGNDATARDASWRPLIETPVHPEYPCAHCIVSGAVASVLEAEVGDAPMPLLTTRSPTADGAARSWTSLDDFVAEVANARIWAGVHYRFSTQTGTAMGRRIGELAARRFLRPAGRTPGDGSP